jgi:hypothetical protein
VRDPGFAQTQTQKEMPMQSRIPILLSTIATICNQTNQAIAVVASDTMLQYDNDSK